jgi:hypothetical protein
MSSGLLCFIVAVALFALLMAVSWVSGLVASRKERLELLRLLHGALPALAGLDIVTLNDKLVALERNYDSNYQKHLARVSDTEGRPLNICPSCGAYLKIDRPPDLVGLYKDANVVPSPCILVCANSPSCTFRKDLSDAGSLALPK